MAKSAKVPAVGGEFAHPTLGTCRVTGHEQGMVFFRAVEERAAPGTPVPEFEPGVYATADVLGGLHVVAEERFGAILAGEKCSAHPEIPLVEAARAVIGG